MLTTVIQEAFRIQLYDIMYKNYSLKYFILVIYFSVFLNIYITNSIHQINEPNVFYVNDDTNEGQRIGRITHFNGNQHVNLLKSGHLKAVIVRANRPPAAYFRLNENTGDLYTRIVIDRESLCLKTYQNDERLNSMTRNVDSNYQSGSFLSDSKIINQCKFTFQVALHRQVSQQQPQQYQSNDPGLHHLPEFIDVHVIVIDRNDHIPTFQPHSIINLSIPESVPIGTRVQLPLAYDPDSPEFSIQRYELYPLESTDFSLYIQTTDVIHNANLIQEITGLFLELKTTLDREIRESYTLEVKAFDSLSSSSSSSTSTSTSASSSVASSPTVNTFIVPRLSDNRNVLKVYLTVEDINDNGPIFQPQNTSTQIDSSNDPILRTIPSSSTGIITYKVDIIESTWPKSSILQLITKDLDSSKYSLTRYEFSSNVEGVIKQLFKLNEHSGELFLKQPLDYEKRTSYTFDILAIDSEYDRRSKLDGSNNLQHLVSSRLQQNIFTSTANILVNVIDINDEIPMIEIDYLRVDETTGGRPATFARIEENSDPPQFIADILVTDRDVNAANSHVICTLMNKPNKFQSNHNHNNNDNKTQLITNSFQLSEVKRQPGLVQYNVLTVRSLDREVNGAIIRIKIQCSDSGEMKKTSEADLVIHILDVNDNSPIIQLISQQTISGSNSNNNNGENIVYLKENAPIGTTVAHFNVTDQDSGENSRITCTLLTMNDPILLNLNDYFHVDPVLCNLITRKPIDRESNYPPIDEIDLTIEVKDHGQPVRKSSITLKVKVINENDNVPVFQNNFYRFSIKENSPIGISVGQIIITDLDGDYARLDVRLQKQEQLPFKLWKSEASSSYGYISADHSEAQVVVYYLNTTKILDREEKSSYEFEVYANDISEEGILGQQRLSMKSFSHTTSATILVTIEDENDNDPVIIFPQQPNKTFILSNSEKKYYQLMTVNANDKDPTSNSFTFMLEREEDLLKLNDNSKSTTMDEIDTKLLKSTELNTNSKYPTSNSFLEIDRSVGTVYLSRDIHQNDTGTHAFRVIVHDSIINPRTASLRFIVKIEPVPPRSHQTKLNSFLDNDHVERRILSGGDSSINPEFVEHNNNYAFNNHYSKLSGSQDYLINRKYDNIRTTFDNHSMPFSPSSSSSGVSSPSSKQLTRRLTGDTVLILSLGLILLILLATLCLVIFARHWSSSSGSSIPQNPNSSDKIRCSELFCCHPTSSGTGSKQQMTTNNETMKKEVVNLFHSSPSTNLQDPQQINLNCDTLRSLDTFNASLSDSYSQKMLDSEHIYYRDCRQFSLLPVITSPVGGESGVFPTDYTALRAVTSCKCCTPPPPGYTYNNNNNNNHTDSGNPHSLESFTNESLKNNMSQTNNIPNGSTVTYYTTLTPRQRSENPTDKRKVRIMTVKENMEMEEEKNFSTDYSVT